MSLTTKRENIQQRGKDFTPTFNTLPLRGRKKDNGGMIKKGDKQIMGRIEHITTQQIIGEWGSIDKFALSHGVSPASTKMVIYVDGAKSRPVEEAMRKYGYLNLLRFEKELRKRGQTFSGYLAEDGLNPVELIETLRMKDAHPEVVSGLKRDGIWGLLERGQGRVHRSDDLGDRPERKARSGSRNKVRARA